MTKSSAYPPTAAEVETANVLSPLSSTTTIELGLARSLKPVPAAVVVTVLSALMVPSMANAFSR